MTPKIYIVSNVFIREMAFSGDGDRICGHAHPHDHVTLLANGKLRVAIAGQETLFEAPAAILIRKDARHEITAVDGPALAFCIHALRDGDQVGDVIDPAMVPAGAGALADIPGVWSLTHQRPAKGQRRKP